MGFFRSGLKYIRLLLTDVNHRNLKWKNLSKMAVNHSGFLNKYWTNHRVILRYVNLNMINYMLGHHMTSPHHTRPSPKKKTIYFSILFISSETNLDDLLPIFHPSFYTALLGKIQWVWVFHDMRSFSYYIFSEKKYFHSFKNLFLSVRTVLNRNWIQVWL